jgi:hypothetical protein
MSSAQSLDSLWMDPGRNDAVVLDQLCSRCSPICTTIARLRRRQPASGSDVIVSDELDILGGNEYAILRNSFGGCKELFLFYDTKDKVQRSANSGCHLCSLVVEAQEDIVPLSSIRTISQQLPNGILLAYCETSLRYFTLQGEGIYICLCELQIDPDDGHKYFPPYGKGNFIV